MSDTSLSLLKNFDENNYLNLNPDVKAAVDRGEMSSGWAHFIMFGYYEKRAGSPESLDTTVKNLLDNNKALPSPPANLCVRVHSADISNYNMIGRIVSFDLYLTINAYAGVFSAESRILDFGCGCGRVVSWLNYLYPDSRFYGTDIDADAIAWCADNLGAIGEFGVNAHNPPLAYPDAYFDCIYSISVFTHLPEEMQFAWLQELQRVSKPGALLLLSIHGEQLFAPEKAELKQQYLDKGFYYSVDQGTEGLPEFYQTTFHTHAYIESEWRRYFEIVKVVKQGIANHQDLVVCRRRPD